MGTTSSIQDIDAKLLELKQVEQINESHKKELLLTFEAIYIDILKHGSNTMEMDMLRQVQNTYIKAKTTVALI